MITYKTDVTPTGEQVVALYKSAGLNRPDDAERMNDIYANSNLIITAWENEELIGVSRSITDFHWSCYLADLAVRKDFQSAGIGRTLLNMTKEYIGDKCMLLLLSAPAAMEYYPKLGMETVNNGFIINRKV
jgi:GNAT superfamily N-acetyltransferase